MMRMTDWRGKKWDIGSTIVYCTSQGSSSAKMTEAIVQEISDSPNEYDHYPLRVKVRVTKVSDQYAYKQRGLTGHSYHEEKIGKVVTLLRTDHITVVSE